MASEKKFVKFQKIFSLSFALIFLCHEVAAFSSKDIISPSEGVWSNVQPLVLNGEDGEELYYSFSGTDPYESGFAYDGPVVIDETGSVTVAITAISKDGERSDFSVSYTVHPVTYQTNNPDTAVFIQNLSLNPIRKYVPGTDFSIPADFSYSLSNEMKPYLSGKTLCLSAASSLDRYLPCTVSDGNISYHFVIHVTPQYTDFASAADVPFVITDWDTFTFTGEKLIYQIDDSFWSADKTPVVLDRSVSHVIRWQSMAYEQGNPVPAFELLPKPALKKTSVQNNVIELSLDTSSKMFLLGNVQSASVASSASGKISSLPAKKLSIDVFEGDSVEGTFYAGVYQNGVYQGALSTECSLDRQSCVPPFIDSSFDGEYSRSAVTVSISSFPGEHIFYAVSEPVVSAEGFTRSSENLFSAVVNEKFKPYDSKPIHLVSVNEHASYYKISAYSVDDAGNRSATAEYGVVVDEYNFYLDCTKKSDAVSAAEEDGSFSRPYTSFTRALGAINSRQYTRLYVAGDVVLDEGIAVVKRNCSIIGDDSRFIFSPLSGLKVQNALLEFSGCILEKNCSAYPAGFLSDSDSFILKHMLLVNGGELRIVRSEVVSVFGEDGILVEAENAKVLLENSGLTVQSNSYACNFSSEDTLLSSQNSRVTAVAPTCLNFSLHGGTCVLNGTSTMVIGRIGRTLEITGAKAKLTNNNFGASLENETKSLAAVWKDADSEFIEYSGNNENGF